MNDLTKKKCIVCEGGESPLKKKEIKPYLKQTTGWIPDKKNKYIEKEFEFKNFVKAISFIKKVAKVAEKEGHHPDIFLHDYKKVKIILTTHAIKGLSENDFIEAAKINKIY
jgi:4a-hydroxytetrahydrobiopterin dehydratase